MAQSSGVGDIFKYGLLAGGAYLAYRAFFSGSTTAAAPAAGAPTYSMADLVAAFKASGGAAATGSTAAPAAGSNTPSTPSSPLQVGDLLTAAGTAGAAGSPPPTFSLDQWSYYAQNAGKGISISPDQMNKIIAAGGGDRSALVTADQFLTAYHAAGLSGLGAAPVRVPILVVRQPDGSARVVALHPHGSGVFARTYVR